MSKKLKEKQQRRLAEEARRARARKQHQRANLITAGVAVVVLLAVGFGVFAAQNNESNPSVGVAASQAGCSKRVTFPSEGNQHVPAGTKVNYKHDPPTTGNHWPPDALLPRAGFYDSAQPPEVLVHHQEHGQLVIWYRPDAPQQVRDQLKELVSESPEVNFAVPWDGIKAPFNFTLSAWDGADNRGVQQSCREVSQQIYDQWRTDFQGKGPEKVGTPTFSQ
jgi:hypothetical protein